MGFYRRAVRQRGVRSLLVAEILWVIGYAPLPVFFHLYARRRSGRTRPRPGRRRSRRRRGSLLPRLAEAEPHGGDAEREGLVQVLAAEQRGRRHDRAGADGEGGEPRRRVPA